MRIKAYIENVQRVLMELNEKAFEDKVKAVLSLAEGYMNDAKYYLEKGDLFTSLSCIAYAEGLIDALNHMGLIKVDWKPLSSLLKRPRVLVAGSFEIIHPGHIHFLRKAWELGEVIVVVSRDINVEKFKKRKPIVPEENRRIVVEAIKYVSRSVLGDKDDLLKPILELKPDVILLGPDQMFNPEELSNKLAEKGLVNVKVFKLNERTGGLYESTSSILSKIIEEYCGKK